MQISDSLSASLSHAVSGKPELMGLYLCQVVDKFFPERGIGDLKGRLATVSNPANDRFYALFEDLLELKRGNIPFQAWAEKLKKCTLFKPGECLFYLTAAKILLSDKKRDDDIEESRETEIQLLDQLSKENQLESTLQHLREILKVVHQVKKNRSPIEQEDFEIDQRELLETLDKIANADGINPLFRDLSVFYKGVVLYKIGERDKSAAIGYFETVKRNGILPEYLQLKGSYYIAKLKCSMAKDQSNPKTAANTYLKAFLILKDIKSKLNPTLEYKAKLHLARMHRLGLGIQSNLTEALTLYEQVYKAPGISERVRVRAAYGLMHIAFHGGEGVAKDKAKAEKLAKEVINSNAADGRSASMAYRFLAAICETANPLQALKLYQKALDIHEEGPDHKKMIERVIDLSFQAKQYHDAFYYLALNGKLTETALNDEIMHKIPIEDREFAKKCAVYQYLMSLDVTILLKGLRENNQLPVATFSIAKFLKMMLGREDDHHLYVKMEVLKQLIPATFASVVPFIPNKTKNLECAAKIILEVGERFLAHIDKDPNKTEEEIGNAYFWFHEVPDASHFKLKAFANILQMLGDYYEKSYSKAEVYQKLKWEIKKAKDYAAAYQIRNPKSKDENLFRLLEAVEKYEKMKNSFTVPPKKRRIPSEQGT